MAKLCLLFVLHAWEFDSWWYFASKMASVYQGFWRKAWRNALENLVHGSQLKDGRVCRIVYWLLISREQSTCLALQVMKEYAEDPLPKPEQDSAFLGTNTDHKVFTWTYPPLPHTCMLTPPCSDITHHASQSFPVRIQAEAEAIQRGLHQAP